MKSKKSIAILATIIMAFQLSACVNGNDENLNEATGAVTEEKNTGEVEEINETTTKKSGTLDIHIPVSIKESPDKYTWYIKDYVGKNCATVGYTSMLGDRRDEYGKGNIRLILVAQDNSYIDIEDDNVLKEYVITGQNLEPNTELKYSFMTDSKGEEYDNLISVQSYDEIVLSVKKIGEETKETTPFTKINAAPDKYTRYVYDYTGRNLANFGYTSMIGDRRVEYGEGNVKLNLISNDGSFIDVEDEEALKTYYVTGQSIEPNTEIKFEFMKDSNGEEYDNLIDTQSIEEMDLYVSLVE